LTVSGVAATRDSPARVSAGTPICILNPPVLVAVGPGRDAVKA
jgi:hypothetical protein